MRNLFTFTQIRKYDTLIEKFFSLLREWLAMMVIDSHCNLYKICTICKETTFIYEFSSAGGGKRRNYCKTCTQVKKLIPKQPNYHCYDYHPSLLVKPVINVTQPTTKGMMRYKIDREMAVSLVKGGAAGITSESSIRRFYTRSMFRNKILDRDKNQCAYCGKKGKRKLTIDHIIPKVDGGLSTFTNCVAACGSCNVAKGRLSISNYLKATGLTSQEEVKKKEQEIISKAFIPNLPIIAYH